MAYYWIKIEDVHFLHVMPKFQLYVVVQQCYKATQQFELLHGPSFIY